MKRAGQLCLTPVALFALASSANAAAYQRLSEAHGGDPVRAWAAAPNEVQKLIERLRESYKAMDSFGYETIEGIVAKPIPS